MNNSWSGPIILVLLMIVGCLAVANVVQNNWQQSPAYAERMKVETELTALQQSHAMLLELSKKWEGKANSDALENWIIAAALCLISVLIVLLAFTIRLLMRNTIKPNGNEGCYVMLIGGNGDEMYRIPKERLLLTKQERRSHDN